MRHQFLITIDTDEATTEELKEAIEDCLLSMDMPNGDTMYCEADIQIVGPEK